MKINLSSYRRSVTQLLRVKSVLGGCPKHRFMLDASKGRLNYLCAGISVISAIYRHILKQWVDLLAHGRPASDIMQAHLMVVNKYKSGHFVAACG